MIDTRGTDMTEDLNLRELIAKQIRLLRLRKGFTQEYLAEKADLGFNYVYRLENKQLNVKVETVEKIMKALDVDIDTFFQVNPLYSTKDDAMIQLLMEDITNLPIEKREPVIKALRSLIEQMK